MGTLTQIQTELKAPKGRYNSFGKYKYRSCEDILEAVKPLLAKHEATLFIRDEMVEVGGRVYVKAVAMFTAGEETVAVTAYAREPESKKGMDEAQVTGTASSYARKYALNGLFLIDDTKDPDTDEYTMQTQRIGKTKAAALEKELGNAGQDLQKILAYYKVSSLEEITEEQQSQIVRMLHGNNRKN